MANTTTETEKAKQYHSIAFHDLTEQGYRNTWDSWFLIPESRPLIASPEPKTQYVDIPGMNGTIDASEVISDQIVYSDRIGSWSFVVANNSCVTDKVPDIDWYTRYTEILSYLQGKRIEVWLLDNPDKVYVGRVTVEWNSDPNAGYSRITMSYVLRPFDKNGNL